VTRRRSRDGGPPTPRESGTLQRGPIYSEQAKALARWFAERVEPYEEAGAKRCAIECRALRDGASLLALEFDSWSTVPTTSEQRVAAITAWEELKKRGDAFRSSR
jgi:hypothetical protein